MINIEHFLADTRDEIRETERSTGRCVAHVALTYTLEADDDPDSHVYTSAGDPWLDTTLFSEAASYIARTHGFDMFAGLDEEPGVE